MWFAVSTMKKVGSSYLLNLDLSNGRRQKGESSFAPRSLGGFYSCSVPLPLSWKQSARAEPPGPSVSTAPGQWVGLTKTGRAISRPSHLTLDLRARNCRLHATKFLRLYIVDMGFPSGSRVKNLPANAGDMALIPGSGGSPGKGNGNPLQYFCLENSMDRGSWLATVHEVAKSQTGLQSDRLNNNKHVVGNWHGDS